MIGLMGSGKTTIGQMLAKRLGMPFLDSDHELEQRTGVSIATIFEIEGEDAFRAREAAIIDELTQRNGIVLGTGGGCVLNADTRSALRSRGTTVYLHSSPETSYERVRRNRDRPLLLVSDPLGRLRQLYEMRHPLYQEAAHFVVESYRDRPGAAVNDIIAVTRCTARDGRPVTAGTRLDAPV
ncbi:MAG: shikimate kinase [Burkholderiales bacterium]|nr:shikimate kinase [Burkholderiales bacterium]